MPKHSAAVLMLLMSLWLGCSAACAAQATSIPTQTIDDPKEFWRVFMRDFYGPYDATRKCWIAKKGVEEFCMRPNTFDVITINGQRQVFATASGNLTTYDATSCQNCTGNIGFFIFAPHTEHLELRAQSDRFLEEGTHGEAPNKDLMRVEKLSGNGIYGWVAKISSFNRGTAFENAEIYAPKGDVIASLGNVPLYYNDTESDCFNVETNSADACSDYRIDTTFDLSKPDAFAPIALHLVGTVKGSAAEKTYIATFDAAKSAYVLPDDFPRNE